MSNPIVIACLVAIFSWWFFTGMILIAVRLCDRLSIAQRQKVCLASLPIFGIGLFGIDYTANLQTTTAVYLGFFAALAVWGWIEFAFLTGVITGPNVTECPTNITPIERFIRAWGTLAYHEIALLASLSVIIYIGWGAENGFGMWTFIILYGARVFAKLNLFFGVPRINVEFVPKALAHLTSHFRVSSMNWFFPISVTLLTFALACWIERIYAMTLAEQIIGFSLLSSMTAMALVEHWVMVLPVPDAQLWRWMIPQKHEQIEQKYRRKDSHGL
ncbi:MAG: DUF3623 domain-containing protein [Rhodobacteraceae bacterium]|jgi:putative photosynthetic complex assembly protein 2|nr:DUF3623 domain-containing protein [Paracoccaceae bacterium]